MFFEVKANLLKIDVRGFPGALVASLCGGHCGLDYEGPGLDYGGMRWIFRLEFLFERIRGSGGFNRVGRVWSICGTCLVKRWDVFG